MKMDFTATFNAALARPDSLIQLREEIVKLRAAGIEKAILLKSLESFRVQVDETTEDTVLEVMDFLVANCSPHMRID